MGLPKHRHKVFHWWRVLKRSSDELPLPPLSSSMAMRCYKTTTSRQHPRVDDVNVLIHFDTYAENVSIPTACMRCPQWVITDRPTRAHSQYLADDNVLFCIGREAWEASECALVVVDISVFSLSPRRK